MTEKAFYPAIKNHFPLIAAGVTLAHLLVMALSYPMATTNRKNIENLLVRDNAFKIVEFRRVGKKEGDSKNMLALLNPPKKMADTVTSPVPKKSLSLADLSAPEKSKKSVTPEVPAQRPGTRPEMAAMRPALEGISLKGGREIKKFVQGSGSDAMVLNGGDQQLSRSNVMVKLEVPEGVDIDELNEYELKFYSFQKRTAQNYVNSLFKNIDEFQKKNPHLHFPMTETKQIMTGRMTYDDKGNIKQIKMIRWSNDDKIQAVFEDILKDMDVLHNPPHALWEKTGEFSVFFTLQLNG